MSKKRLLTTLVAGGMLSAWIGLNYNSLLDKQQGSAIYIQKDISSKEETKDKSTREN